MRPLRQLVETWSFALRMTAVVAVSAVITSASKAVEYSSLTTDADVVAMGDHDASRNLVGSVVGKLQSGGVLHASVTMATDLDGNPLPIAATPSAFLTSVNLSGFGLRGMEGGSFVQDGLPGGGTGPTSPVQLGVNATDFCNTFYDPGTYGSSNVSGRPGDSGGRVSIDIPGGGDEMIGLISAGVGALTVFSRFDAAETWIDSYTSQGGVWAITGAHVGTNSADPITLEQVDLGTNYNSPTHVFNIIGAYKYPGSLSDGVNVDFSHPDLEMLQLQEVPIPEPASVMILGVSLLALLRSQKRV
jgi:hypothetical protein